jgi:DNA repair photolyase
MAVLKSALTVRGDSVYCPLSFSLDSYWNCLTDCHHCYFRHLNHTWGTDLRPADPEETRKKLINGLKNKNPRSPLAQCLSRKKTIRFGNKTDPFQLAELKYGVSARHLEILTELDWTFVIQTRFTEHLRDCVDTLVEAAEKDLVTVMPVVSPGLARDWEILERGRTTHPIQRLHDLREMGKMGCKTGVNGEPFIPGWHTVKDFELTLLALKDYGIKSYNTYNFHFNAFVAKRLAAIDVDIERIWTMNQDKNWKPILRQLLDLGKKHDIKIGCPDFVNTGADHREPANTCCGVDVANPTRFNSHYFKRLKQKGMDDEKILSKCWDGSAKREDGEAVLKGKRSGFFTLKEAGL